MGSTAVAACGKFALPGPSDEEGTTFMNWEPTKGTPLADAIQAFEKESGDNVIIQPIPSGDYDTKMRTVLAGDVAPDVMRINDDYVQGFSRDGALTDLRPYMKKDNIDESQFSAGPFSFPEQPDGSYTSWVIGHQPRLIIYNVDAFKEAGAPMPPTEWTSTNWMWDDFLATAKKLTIPGKRWGALVYYDTGYEQTFSTNNGSPTGIYSEDGTSLTLADPKGVEAVQWATDLTCVHKVQPPWSELQQDSIDLQLFSQGKIAMIFATFGAVPYLRETVKDFTWDVAPPPAKVEQKTESSLIVFCIPKIAEKPDKGWELLEFLSSEEGGKILAKAKAFNPIDKTAAEFVKPDGQPPEHIELFVTALDHLTTTNKTNNTVTARDIYRIALEKTYSCDKSAEEVLTSVRDQVEEELRG